MEKLKELLKSRKFWASLIGLVVMVWKLFDPNAPDEAALEPLIGVIVIIVGYVLGTALEDGLARFNSL